jgi:hypothetical protein
MSTFVGLTGFFRAPKALITKLATSPGFKTEPSVALVKGGAILGFDEQVHIDLDRAHTVLTPDEARRFAAHLETIASTIELS